jgi:hypothetical protein
MLEHPLLTAATAYPPAAAAMAAKMAVDVGQYGVEKYQESRMTPEERVIAEKAPGRISGEDAAWNAALLAVPFLVHGGIEARGRAGVRATEAAPMAAPGITPDAATLATVGASPKGFGPRQPLPSTEFTPKLTELVKEAETAPAPSSAAVRAAVRPPPEEMAITDVIGKGKTNYGKLSDPELVQALQGEQRLLEQNLNHPGRAGWTRFDDDISTQLSGGTFSGGKALNQGKFALARITRIENELAKRGMTQDEIAAHRMSATERAGIAADEGDASFDFGSEKPTAPEYRNVGIGLTPEQLKAAGEAVGEAVTNPNARVSAEHPSLDQAISSANAMTPENAATFVRQLGGRVLRGLTDEQKGWFGKRLVADQLEAEAVRKASDPAVATRLASEAQKIRAALPPGIETQPWFQRALSAHKTMVQPFNELAAGEAGVDPGSFRQPSLGAYVRLIPQDRLSEALINRTQDIAASQGVGAVTPRTGLIRKVLGQKRGVIQTSPAGTERPLHGPASTIREGGGAGRAPSDVTKVSGSASRVVGITRGYSTDYLTNVAFDAADKVSKATQNQIYRAVANDQTGKIVELTPDQNAPPGNRVIAFDDRNQLVQPPPPGQPIPAGLRRFAVPENVATAVKRYQASPLPSGRLGRVIKSGLGAITRSVLSNPMVAAWHSATLASSVGTGVPEAGMVATAASHLPIAKTGVTLARFADVNFSDPATITRLQRLARNGALRLSDERGRSILSVGHKMLFGPEGVDMRARVVASEDFQKAAKARAIPPNSAKYAVLERNYVNEHAGNYIGKNQGTATQWLQESGIAPFIAINRAKWGTSLKALGGADGTPSPSVLRRLSVAARGPLGAAGAIAIANYALSGHGPDQNAPGHESDLATGIYHLPDGSIQYKPGAPSDALASFPKGTKEMYIKGSLLDPATSGARRLLGPMIGARKGNLAEDETRAVVNEALQLIGPGPQAAFSLGTGRTLHIGMDNDLASIEDPHLTGNERMRSRVAGAVRSANAAAALTIPPTGDQPRDQFLSRFLAEANPLGRENAERRQEGDWQDAIVTRIYSEPDPAKKQRIVDQALGEAQQYGYNTSWLRGQFTKALNRSMAGSSAAGTKFLNRLKGGVQ